MPGEKSPPLPPELRRALQPEMLLVREVLDQLGGRVIAAAQTVCDFEKEDPTGTTAVIALTDVEFLAMRVEPGWLQAWAAELRGVGLSLELHGRPGEEPSFRIRPIPPVSVTSKSE